MLPLKANGTSIGIGRKARFSRIDRWSKWVGGCYDKYYDFVLVRIMFYDFDFWKSSSTLKIHESFISVKIHFSFIF